MVDFEQFLVVAKEIYGDDKFIPLHSPIFAGNEKKYLSECIDSTYVSSVGEKVIAFEQQVASFLGVKHAVAVVNGTAALHIGLLTASVSAGDEVLTQALTFVATCNAISYIGAKPVFIDVDIDTMGMGPEHLEKFLTLNARKTGGHAFNKLTGNRIGACVPMHTFGLPCRIKEIAAICKAWGIPLVEDAAESLGSTVGGRHTGSFGISGAISFNGNKIITTGGGGMLVTNDDSVARRARHISTTAKVPHPFEFIHDEIGYNFRMPNINAAIGCAQMERLQDILDAKSTVSNKWLNFFDSQGLKLGGSSDQTKQNHWLINVVMASRSERDEFIAYTNDNSVMTRPIWKLLSSLPIYKDCLADDLINSKWLEERVVCIPSGVPDGVL